MGLGPGLHRRDRELLERIAAGEGPRVALEAVVAAVGRRGCDVCVLVQALALAEIAAEALAAGVVSPGEVEAFCRAAAEVWLVASLAGVGAGDAGAGAAGHGEDLVTAVAAGLGAAGCCGQRLRAHASVLAAAASLLG